MKRTKSNIKVKSEVFTPLVNLLLFNEFKTPDFNSENEKLSEEYSIDIKNIKEMPLSEMFNQNNTDFRKEEKHKKIGFNR